MVWLATSTEKEHVLRGFRGIGSSRSMGIVLAAALGLLCPTALVRSPRAGIAPDGSETRAAGLTHPGRIGLPKDLAAVEICQNWKTGEKQVIFPIAIYTISHYDGWQECLYRFGKHRVDMEGNELHGAPFQLWEPYTMRGMRDGFETCRKRVVVLRKRYSEKQVRRMALEAYTPRGGSLMRGRLYP